MWGVPAMRTERRRLREAKVALKYLPTIDQATLMIRKTVGCATGF